MMPSGFANDSDRSRFAVDLKWMKEDRNGGRKDRRIELGEVCGRFTGRTMEIRERDKHEQK